MNLDFNHINITFKNLNHVIKFNLHYLVQVFILVIQFLCKKSRKTATWEKRICLQFWFLRENAHQYTDVINGKQSIINMTVIKRASLGRNVSLLIWNSVKIMLRLFFVLINVPLFVNISFMDHVCGFYIKLSLSSLNFSKFFNSCDLTQRKHISSYLLKIK